MLGTSFGILLFRKAINFLQSGPGTILLVSFLFGIIWFAYSPSLKHIPRADHWHYLINTMDNTDFYDNISRTYSYNRTRIVAPGDVALFRPVFFSFLAFEKALFRNNFAYWQAAGVMLHFLNALLLLWLMSNFLRYSVPRSQNGDAWDSGSVVTLFPFVLTLFFALNFSIQDMVTWTHIHGYMLFAAFALGAILMGFRAVSDEQLSILYKRILILIAWFLTLLATFTYELGQFLALFLGLFLAVGLYREGKQKKSLAYFGLFASIAIIYQVANVADMRAHHGEFDTDIDLQLVVNEMFKLRSLDNIKEFLNYTVIQPFFPSEARGSLAGDRLSISYPWKQIGLYSILSALVMSILGFFAVTSIRWIRSDMAKTTLLMLMLLSGMFLSYTGIIVFGRMNMRPHPELLNFNSYYTYLSLLFVILILSLFIFNERDFRGKALPGYFSVALLIGMFVLALYSADKVRKSNNMVAARYDHIRNALDQITAFIGSKNTEKDFTLAFNLPESDPLPTWHGIPVTTILFRSHENNFNPKYVVRINNGSLTDQRITQYKKLRPAPRGQLFPALVRPGSSYNIFYYDGYYIGVLHWNGYYDPQRTDYDYIIKDLTLKGLRKRELIARSQQEGDIKSGRFLLKEKAVGSLQLVKEGYRGFNILELDKRFFAIPQGEGAFDWEKLQKKRYSISFVANSYDEILRQIDASLE